MDLQATLIRMYAFSRVYERVSCGDGLRGFGKSYENIQTAGKFTVLRERESLAQGS